MPSPTYVEMDERVPLSAQMNQECGSVILVNKFTVAPEEVKRLLEVWQSDSGFMKRQPGFISAQLHRGTCGSCAFLNYAVWESVAAFRSAATNPDFRKIVHNSPPSMVASPHLFQKIAIPGVCVA
jgi:heme-degrading monooxygenase HmoA